MHPLAELYKMVCERNETDLDIGIPAVLLPKDAGSSLQSLLSSGEGKFDALLYSCEYGGACVPSTFSIYANLIVGYLL